jgi:hypothetical protein
MNKESIRLVIKLRIKGAIHELAKIKEKKVELTIANVNVVTKLL